MPSLLINYQWNKELIFEKRFNQCIVKRKVKKLWIQKIKILQQEIVIHTLLLNYKKPLDKDTQGYYFKN